MAAKLTAIEQTATTIATTITVTDSTIDAVAVANAATNIHAPATGPSCAERRRRGFRFTGGRRT